MIWDSVAPRSATQSVPRGPLAARLLCSFLCFQNSCHNFLFFNQEGSDNPFSDSFVTTRTTIGTGHCLLSFAHGSKFMRTNSPYASKRSLVISTYWYFSQFFLVQIYKFSTWCF